MRNLTFKIITETERIISWMAELAQQPESYSSFMRKKKLRKDFNTKLKIR